MSVDDDLVEPGVVEGLGERGQARGLVADTLEDVVEARGGVGLFAGQAGGRFGGFPFSHWGSLSEQFRIADFGMRIGGR